MIPPVFDTPASWRNRIDGAAVAGFDRRSRSAIATYAEACADLVRLPRLANLPLQDPDALRLLAYRPGTLSLVTLGRANPAPQYFRHQVEYEPVDCAAGPQLRHERM